MISRPLTALSKISAGVSLCGLQVKLKGVLQQSLLDLADGLIRALIVLCLSEVSASILFSLTLGMSKGQHWKILF